MDALILFIIAIAWVCIDCYKDNKRTKMINRYKSQGNIKKMMEWIKK